MRGRMVERILDLYRRISASTKRDSGSAGITELLEELSTICLERLSRYERFRLLSKVSGKTYFAFKDGKSLSRPVNDALLLDDQSVTRRFLSAVASGDFTGLCSEDATKACYSLAIDFCCAVDLTKKGDQKTPGTFFECLISHFFSRRLGVNPKRQIEVLNLDMRTTLPTDFIYDLGADKPKFHLPVKTSTRERVIQVWGHQRILDGVYGTGRFRGVLVCMAETKLSHKTYEVIEICLPDQWRLYQMFIAQMERVYYLDLPSRYASLNDSFPRISVKPFGEFFFESERLME